MVAPNYTVIDGVVGIIAGSKAEAVRSVAAAADRLTAELAALCGVPFDLSAQRPVLTWAAHSADSYEEQYPDKEAGRMQRTGQVTATVSLRVIVRDFDALDRLRGVLAEHQSMNVHAVSWHVDWDKAAWPHVRAAAIRSAVQRPVITMLPWAAPCNTSRMSPTSGSSAATARPTIRARRGASPLALSYLTPRR